MGNPHDIAKIRALNDEFRRTGRGGYTRITAGVKAEGVLFPLQAILAVQALEILPDGDDPHGEHDFGALDIGERKIFWKIDYYDLTMEFGSEDPSDPAVTTRVLTIMMADEY